MILGAEDNALGCINAVPNLQGVLDSATSELHYTVALRYPKGYMSSWDLQGRRSRINRSDPYLKDPRRL